MNDINTKLGKEFLVGENVIVRKSNMMKRFLSLLVYVLIIYAIFTLTALLGFAINIMFAYILMLVPLFIFNSAYPNAFKLQFLTDTKSMKYRPKGDGVPFSEFDKVVTVGSRDEKIPNAFRDKNDRVFLPNKKDSTYFTVLVLKNGHGVYLARGSKEKCDDITDVFNKVVILQEGL